MAYTRTSPELACRLLVQGMEAELRNTVERMLHDQIDPILTKAAKEAAESLVTRVEAFHDIGEMKFHLLVRLNDKEL